MSGGRVFVSTTAPGFRAHLFSRPTDGGAWQDDPVTTDSVSRSLDLVSSGGSATVFYSNESKLLERSTL